MEVYPSDKQLECLKVLRCSMVILCPGKCRVMPQFIPKPLPRMLCYTSTHSEPYNSMLCTLSCYWNHGYPSNRLQGAESFLKSLVFHLIKVFPAFYGNPSLSCSQPPATCPYPEPDEFNPCTPFHFMMINFNIILPSTPRSSAWSLLHIVVKKW